MGDGAVLRRAAGTVATALQIAIRVAAVLGGAMLVAIVLLISMDVSSRYVLGSSVLLAVSLSEMALVGAVYLGLAEAFRTDQHVAVGLVLGRLGRRTARVVAVLRMAISVAVTWWMLRASLLALSESRARREMRFGVIDVIVWPARLLVVIGLVLLILAMLERILRGDLASVHDRDHWDDAAEADGRTA